VRLARQLGRADQTGVRHGWYEQALAGRIRSGSRPMVCQFAAKMTV
jgi:hypothetical protein